MYHPAAFKANTRRQIKVLPNARFDTPLAFLFDIFPGVESHTLYKIQLMIQKRGLIIDSRMMLLS